MTWMLAAAVPALLALAFAAAAVTGQPYDPDDEWGRRDGRPPR